MNKTYVIERLNGKKSEKPALFLIYTMDMYSWTNYVQLAKKFDTEDLARREAVKVVKEGISYRIITYYMQWEKP